MQDLQIFVVLLEPIVQKPRGNDLHAEAQIRQYWGVWTARRPFKWQMRKADENTGDALIKGMLCPQKGQLWSVLRCERHKSEDRLALEPRQDKTDLSVGGRMDRI
jgi:hypothetical protein